MPIAPLVANERTGAAFVKTGEFLARPTAVNRLLLSLLIMLIFPSIVSSILATVSGLLTSLIFPFAHVVEGNDVMDLLRPGDMLVHADVKDESLGTYNLVNLDDEADNVIPFEEEED